MFGLDFDGDSKGRRNVRMGGRNKREESKADFLARARSERVARETVRERTRAAGLAQRWWRGRRCAAVARAMMRSEWDQQLAQLQQVIAAFAQKGVNFPMPVETLNVFVRKLIFFHSATVPGEAHRVSHLCQLVQRSCIIPEAKQNFLAAASAEDPSTVRSWCHLNVRFLTIVLEHLARMIVLGAQARDASGFPEVLCELLETYLSAKTWSIAFQTAVDVESMAAGPCARVLLATGAYSGRLHELLRLCWTRADADKPRLTVLALNLSLKAMGVTGNGLVALPDGPRPRTLHEQVRGAGTCVA